MEDYTTYIIARLSRYAVPSSPPRKGAKGELAGNGSRFYTLSLSFAYFGGFRKGVEAKQYVMEIGSER